MSSHLSRITLAAAASAFGLCACAVKPSPPPVVVECSTPTNPQRPGPALVGQPYGMGMTALPVNSVQFASGGLARSMAIQSLHAARTPTQTVRVQARFVSCADEPLTIRVRTAFLRSDTAPAEAPSAWRPVFLTPRATAVYEEVSSVTDATSFLIEVGS